MRRECYNQRFSGCENKMGKNKRFSLNVPSLSLYVSCPHDFNLIYAFKQMKRGLIVLLIYFRASSALLGTPSGTWLLSQSQGGI